ncbi:APC family permease [Salinisphaera hydrothermalis]|uniref:Putrescine:hydrogen symporter PuuP n=1 Tax=Salinisphaera hydrothermalis (strain C41B8) TaxID=1304275 RepID=A0A084IKT5_SALHC|nr:APC family permease [Salinisphaera hydrothermalis]KEZ77319.1 putrescine:hydrogen symporter PuuP [Salinisphaera hydrothermalis C41B8]
MSATTDDQPTLQRSLGLGSVVLTGVAYMAPMIVLGTFGVVAEASNGTVPTAYIVTLIAMLFTAYSYGRMARAYPVSGSAYTYVGKGIGPKLGFLAGWLILLDYFFLPLVIWLIGAAFLSPEFPGVPNWVWILAFIGLTTALNIIGIKVATGVNFVLMAFQILVLVIFVALSFGHFFAGDTGATALTPFFNPQTSVAAISAGAALAAYSFIGFDAVTTLTEETKDPKRNIPRAVVITALIGGVVFIITSYAVELAHPGTHFKETDSAAYEIAMTIGGNLFASLFIAGMVVTQFCSGIAAQATASRLLYAMGRDGVLPKRVFAYVAPKLHTPVFSIALIGIVGLAAVWMSVSTSTSFINFGAFSAFTLVNLSVIVHFWRERSTTDVGSIIGWLIVPLIGAAIDAYLLFSLDTPAHVVGGIWLLLGLGMLAWLTRGFSQAPPEMAIGE